MKVVNVFGGPGIGKSTVSADLFALMKWNKINCELVNEFAKDLTWENRHSVLKDQVYVFAKQNRKLERIRDQVDYAITDSPLMLAAIYAGPDYYDKFIPLARQVFDSYENVNFLLKRRKEYVKIGRSQTEDEARKIDERVQNLMDATNIKYTEIDADDTARNTIFKHLFSTV